MNNMRTWTQTREAMKIVRILPGLEPRNFCLCVLDIQGRKRAWWLEAYKIGQRCIDDKRHKTLGNEGWEWFEPWLVCDTSTEGTITSRLQKEWVEADET